MGRPRRLDEGVADLKIDLWNGRGSSENLLIGAHKTPLRISVIGGGTDMPEYVEQSGWGMCLSLSINLGVAAMVQTSRTAVVPHIDVRCDTPLTHEIMSRTLLGKNMLIKKIMMVEDVDTIGTGLGSSSAWTSSLYAALDSPVGALTTFETERSTGSNCGYQDHAAAWYSSSGAFKFSRGVGAFAYRDLPNAKWLAERVSLHRIYGARDSNSILTKQVEKVKSGRVDELNAVRDLTETFLAALVMNDEERCGALLKDAWTIKKTYAPNVTNDDIDEAVNAALEAGAYSAKILGAGSAGYLMVFRNPSKKGAVNTALAEIDCPLVKYDLHGRY